MNTSISTCLFKVTTQIHQFKIEAYRDFPCSPVVKILPSNAGGVGLIPGRGAKIHMPRGQKTKT